MYPRFHTCEGPGATPSLEAAPLAGSGSERRLRKPNYLVSVLVPRPRGRREQAHHLITFPERQSTYFPNRHRGDHGEVGKDT